MYVGGPAASAADQIKIFKGIDTTLLYATLAVVIVLLLLTYRSPVLWLLPILSAGVALTVAQAVIYLLTQHANLTVNGQSEGILVVLVIGASTDYALLLIARYREELRRHADRHEAMAVALRRAGPAIIASGLTVVAGMLCLLAAESNDISGLGPVAAIGIARGPDRHDHAAARDPRDLRPVDLLAGQAGLRLGRADQPRGVVPGRPGHQPPPAHGVAGDRDPAGGRRAGLIGFKFGPLTVAQSFRGTPPSITAQNVLAEYFPAGSGEPVQVIATAGSAGQVRAALAGTDGIASVTPPVTKDGRAFLQATMTMPPDSPAAYTLVDKVRTDGARHPRRATPRSAAAPRSTRTWRAPRRMTGTCSSR